MSIWQAAINISVAWQVILVMLVLIVIVAVHIKRK